MTTTSPRNDKTWPQYTSQIIIEDGEQYGEPVKGVSIVVNSIHVHIEVTYEYDGDTGLWAPQGYDDTVGLFVQDANTDEWYKVNKYTTVKDSRYDNKD